MNGKKAEVKQDRRKTKDTNTADFEKKFLAR